MLHPCSNKTPEVTLFIVSTLVRSEMECNAGILFYTIFLLRCVAVITVAPGDQQSQCTTTQGSDAPGLDLVNAYTSTQTPLMDMYWYALAFGNFGNGVWESIKGSNGFQTDGVSACVFSSVQTASHAAGVCMHYKLYCVHV